MRFIISWFIPYIHGFRYFVIGTTSNHISIIRSIQQQVGSIKFKNEWNTDSILSSQRAVEYYLHRIQAPRVIITAAHWLWYHPILLVSARRGISCRNTFAFAQRTAGVQCPVPLSAASTSELCEFLYFVDSIITANEQVETITVWNRLVSLFPGYSVIGEWDSH